MKEETLKNLSESSKQKSRGELEKGSAGIE